MRRKIPLFVLGGLLVLAFLLLASPGDRVARAQTGVAYDMVGSSSLNLNSFTNNAPPFSASADGFGKFQRGVSASIPFSLLDDTLSIFPPDSLGIIGEGNTDEFFGATDTENADNSGPVTAEWRFDVSGVSDLLLSIDVGAMGDFESDNDSFQWTYQIDGGPVQTAFASTVNEEGSFTYVMDSGANFTLDDPMELNGVTLTNDLQTFTTALAGSGSELVLTLTASTDGGSEAFAFQNLVIQEGTIAAPDVAISEVRIDQPGDDNDEFFELAGTPGAALDGLTYVVLGDGSGGSGVVEAVVDLSGNTVPGSGFFVAAESTFSLGSADLTTNLNFENGDNVTHLLVGGFSGSNGDDLDTDDDGVLDVIPWTTEVDCVALVEDLGSGEQVYCGNTVGPDGSFVPGHAFLCEDGWRIGAFGTGSETPGAENPCDVGIPFGACGDGLETPIHVIQGDGAASPEAGNTHNVEGVVVGDYQDTSTGLSGFFLQEEDGDTDGDAQTSEGIFVFDDGFGMDVNPGDVVRAQGVATEFFDLTELGDVSNVEVCTPGAGGASQATVTLPVDDLGDWEAFEGMLVHIPQTLTANDNFNLGRFGEVLLSAEGRLFIPTSVVEPGAPAVALQDENDRRSIQLDDGSNVQNPLPLPPYVGPDNTLRAGDTVDGLTGVLSFSFGAYEIHPVGPIDFTRVNERPALPDVGGSIAVASFNVLNYFTTIDTGAPNCGPTGGQDCRGADSLEELERQRAKILTALGTLNADVVGLMEIQNDAGASVEDLVNGLNDALGAGTYDYIDTGTIGTDAIKVALIYKPGSVTPVGDYAILDSSVDARFLDDFNRPALAQTFQENGTDDVVTVVVNHLKSKGSPCDAVGDPDVGDGQGNCNVTRTQAAEAMVDWLATDPTGSGSSDFLVTGDLNAYDKEDPIDVFLDNGYTDLVAQYDGEFAYSFVFFGQAGYLDHGLASPSLNSRVTSAAVWHINADEPSALDYNDFNQPALYQPHQYRSSDHDPVVVGICETTPPEVAVSVSPDTLWPPNHQYVDVTATVDVTDADPNANVTLLSVTSNEPDDGLGDGDTPDDIVVVDDFTFRLRAERAGTGDGRIYTVTYQVTDNCGNSTVATATVTVPLSMGQSSAPGR